MSNVDTSPRPFAYPTKLAYDPVQLFADSFGIFIESETYPLEVVEIALTARWAKHVQTHRWHRSQKVMLEPDRVRVSMRVRVCPEVQAWVLSFGADAEVLQPLGLREAVADHALRLSKMYATARSEEVAP
jgi:predicted DNA-binding transcriptional regulator YafY